MKWNMVILLLMLLTLLIAGCGDDEIDLGPDADPDAIPDLIGNYVVSGSDHLDNDYGGHLTIAAGANPGEYELQWILIESVQTGFGVLKGNQLHVEWESIDSSTEPYSGMVIYTITEKGALYGTRTVAGQTGSGEEIAYPNE